MDPITMAVASALIRAVGAAVVDARIAPATVKKITDLASALLDNVATTQTEIQELTVQIEAMVEAGVNPTADEWSDLMGQSDAAHAVIQAWKAGES